MANQSVVPAAAYLRMSTEHQRYSLKNQLARIEEFASLHNFRIVETYVDEGKTGVVLRYRSGLRRLLEDVTRGGVPFRAILVYDVSRWGRFQDIDESAHYEFICKSAGIPVYYCAEQFTNDGSIPSSIMKALKRTMAAEQSRELGVKVYAGQKRLVQLGYRMGSSPGYGLRRLLVSSDGVPKQTLQDGQHKNLVEDHVILVPGPQVELQWVRTIFDWWIQKKRTAAGIARELNRKGVKWVNGKPWTRDSVEGILKNQKYVGANVWGKTSTRLYEKQTKLPKEKWVINDQAYRPIISSETFHRAQVERRRRREGVPNEIILKRVKQLLARNGRLSDNIFRNDPKMLSTPMLYERFGSLSHLYELVGYRQTPINSIKSAYARRSYYLRKRLIEQIVALFPGRVSLFNLPGHYRGILRFENGVIVSVKVCTCLRTAKGPMWNSLPNPDESKYLTLLALMNPQNDGFSRFYLVSGSTIPRTYLREKNAWLIRQLQLSSLSELYERVKTMFGGGLTAPQGF